MHKFILMVNKQGQTRLAEYCEFMSIDERVALEAEIIRKCLSRTETQVPEGGGCARDSGALLNSHPYIRPPPGSANREGKGCTLLLLILL